jgi:hypothetical protein
LVVVHPAEIENQLLDPVRGRRIQARDFECKVPRPGAVLLDLIETETLVDRALCLLDMLDSLVGLHGFFFPKTPGTNEDVVLTYRVADHG